MAKIRRKKMIIISVTIVAVFFISIATVGAIKSKDDGGIPVKTTEIKKQDIESNIITSGTVISKEERNITSDLSGKVKEILVEEGEKVKKGQLLAKLDSRDLEHDLQQAKINLEIAQGELEQLKSEDMMEFEINYKNAEIEYNDAVDEYEDQKLLYEVGGVSKSELEDAKSMMDRQYNNYILAKKNYEDVCNTYEIEVQEKRIQGAELNIKKYQEDLENSIIRSPIDGTVVDKKVSELDVVSSSTEMFVIQDTDNLEVVTDISEYDISEVKIGQRVKVTGEGVGDKEYGGIVKYISPNAVTIKNGSSTETIVEVKIEIKDKNTEFKPNFSADIEINTAQKNGALVLPYEAIYSDKDSTKVIYLVENNKAKRTVVETGIEGDMVVEILGENLKENDKVILNPTEMIKDGVEVKVDEGMKRENDKN